MRATTTSASPSPRRPTKTRVATLVAICALGAGAQALTPASAGAMVDQQQSGGCLAVPNAKGWFDWKTSSGAPCNPKDADWEALTDAGIGNLYRIIDLPSRFYGLELPYNGGAGGLPDPDGVQHMSAGPFGNLAGKLGKALRRLLRGRGKPKALPEKTPASKGKGSETAPPKQTTPPKAEPWECKIMEKEIPVMHGLHVKAKAGAALAKKRGDADEAVRLAGVSEHWRAQRDDLRRQYTKRGCGLAPLTVLFGR